MDVTSLLNVGSGARVERRDSIDQAHTPSAIDGTTPSTTPFPTPSPENPPSRRSSESRVRIGGRTPWDAGGYSLPLSLDTKNLQTSAKPAFYFSESPIETAPSASPNSPRHKCSDSQSSLSSYASSANSVSHSRISSLSTVSEFQPLGNILTEMASVEKMADPILAVSCPPTTIEVSPPSPVLEESPSRMPNDDDGSQLGSEHGSSATMRRPQSPSDAVMITRLQGEERRGSEDSIGTVFKTSGNTFLSPEQAQPKSHKRANSAPDISGLGGAGTYAIARPGIDAMSDQEQSDAVSQHTLEKGSVTPAPEQPVDDVVSSETPPFTEKDKKCLFMENCDTGSTLRKAISHIFGRNKLCTRSIPEEVWVHYCRKHYQRSRYRNIKDWVIKCAELVGVQVQHIDAWSRWNAAHNKEAGVVTGWNITIRKREQKRLQEIGKKRSLPMDDEDDYEDTADSADLTGSAVPSWIHEWMNKTLTTPDVLKVVGRLLEELRSETSSTMPDIEILPEIDTTKTARARTAPRANSNRRTGATHRRSQSMGQPLGYGNQHVEKRARLGFHDTNMLGSSYSTYSMSPLGAHTRFPTYPTYGAPQPSHLNAPSPQRAMGSNPMASHFENPGSFYGSGSPYEGRKVSHQRSHSEVPLSYRQTPPQDYQLPSITNYQPADNTGGYYPRTAQNDASFRSSSQSLYGAQRDARPAYAQSPGFVASSYTTASTQPPYGYAGYSSPATAGPSPNQAHPSAMSPPSSSMRSSMGPDMTSAHTAGMGATASRHMRHQSSPAVPRIGGFQSSMNQGVATGSSMVLPHHPAGPWGPTRQDSEQATYTPYAIPEAGREAAFGTPRY